MFSTLFARAILTYQFISNGIIGRLELLFGHYLFGDTTFEYALNDTNIILVVFIHPYAQLRHSHVWIAFRGVAELFFIRLAHHQGHHSDDPDHSNKNHRSCPALWDWLWGTFYMPQKEREKLTFGVPGHTNAHTVKGELFAPFVGCPSSQATHTNSARTA